MDGGYLNKPPEKNGQPEHKPVPFDDALRRILSAPPQHKVAKKKAKKK
jgi:hypothetical protein